MSLYNIFEDLNLLNEGKNPENTIINDSALVDIGTLMREELFTEDNKLNTIGNYEFLGDKLIDFIDTNKMDDIYGKDVWKNFPFSKVCGNKDASSIKRDNFLKNTLIYFNNGNPQSISALYRKIRGSSGGSPDRWGVDQSRPRRIQDAILNKKYLSGTVNAKNSILTDPRCYGLIDQIDITATKTLPWCQKYIDPSLDNLGFYSEVPVVFKRCAEHTKTYGPTFVEKFDTVAKRLYVCDYCTIAAVRAQRISVPECYLKSLLTQVCLKVPGLELIQIDTQKPIIDTNMTLDIYLEKGGVSVGVEYDGAYWHDKNRLASDIRKDKCCSYLTKLIRVRGDGCPELAPEPNLTVLPVTLSKTTATEEHVSQILTCILSPFDPDISEKLSKAQIDYSFKF